MFLWWSNCSQLGVEHLRFHASLGNPIQSTRYSSVKSPSFQIQIRETRLDLRCEFDRMDVFSFCTKKRSSFAALQSVGSDCFIKIICFWKPSKKHITHILMAFQRSTSPDLLQFSILFPKACKEAVATLKRQCAMEVGTPSFRVKNWRFFDMGVSLNGGTPKTLQNDHF